MKYWSVNPHIKLLYFGTNYNFILGFFCILESEGGIQLVLLIMNGKHPCVATGLEKHGRSVAQSERGVATGAAVWIDGGGEEGGTVGGDYDSAKFKNPIGGSVLQIIQGGAFPLRPCWVDFDVTCCPASCQHKHGQRFEHKKSKSTQPRHQRRCPTL